MYDAQDEPALIRGLQQGDRHAWTALYEHYSAPVWRYVGSLLGEDEAGVADVFQETFLAAANGARRFDAARGTIRVWLIGIAHHRVSGYWRQKARADRVRRLAEAGAPAVLHWLDRTEDASEILQARATADLVRSVLAELPSESAELLMQKYLEEQSLEKIAASRGTTVDAIKSKLARIRREFRAKFERFSREPSCQSDLSP